MGDAIKVSIKFLELKTVSNKLLPVWIGPLEVIEVVQQNVLRLRLPPEHSQRHDVFPTALLERWHVPIAWPSQCEAHTPVPPILNGEGEELFHIERLLARKHPHKGRPAE